MSIEPVSIHIVIGTTTTIDLTIVKIGDTPQLIKNGTQNDIVHTNDMLKREKCTKLNLIKQSCQNKSVLSTKKARKVSGSDKVSCFSFCFLSFLLQRATKAISM
tara:strand:+ start:343 stop:654 length:312 start_codon:yes stop_codon:yes gene_type:complete